MKQDYPSESDFEAAAWLLKCDVAAIKAVAKVESGPLGAFLQDEEGEPPVILYERHYFYRLTGSEASPFKDAQLPGVAEKFSWLCKRTPGGYGPVSIQHKKLHAAVNMPILPHEKEWTRKMVRDAALMSCSWGLFQIMGANHEKCAYPDLQRFVNAMYRSVQDHLRAFTMFIRYDKRLVDALRRQPTPDFRTFKRIYNGPADNGYELRMQKAYEEYNKGR